MKEISGGYCGGVPPLSIPNREVKPTCADGTAMQCGRVGSRLLLQSSALKTEMFSGLFCVYTVAVDYYLVAFVLLHSCTWTITYLLLCYYIIIVVLLYSCFLVFV